MNHAGFGLAHGTFGELIQGQIGDQRFLVTCPINRYSVARFFPYNHSTIYGSRVKLKAVAALLDLQKRLNGKGGALYLSSNIPTGKGMASSSADIVAACRAYAAAHQMVLNPATISDVATRVEPTDGVMYDQPVMYDHIHGHLLQSFDEANYLLILGVDTGGTVDTVAFHRSVDMPYTISEQEKLLRAIQMLGRGLRTRTSTLIGEATTLSARINQRRLLKPNLEKLIALARTYGGLGVVSAHSGTVMGILWDVKLSGSYRTVKAALTDVFGAVSVFTVVQGERMDLTLPLSLI